MLKRTDKVITKYVKNKYPAVYTEAVGYYETLNKLYPNKIDLTKTAEFISLTKPEESAATTIQLRIPLMSPAQVKKTASAATETTVEVLEESSLPIPPVAAHVMFDENCEVVPDPLSLPMDQETMDQLMSELLEDPDVGDWFKNLEFEEDNCPLW